MRLRSDPVTLEQAAAAGWTLVEITGDHYWPMERWAQHNCQRFLSESAIVPDVRYGQARCVSRFVFASASDATMFQLRWS